MFNKKPFIFGVKDLLFTIERINIKNFYMNTLIRNIYL